jgi:hypothetical protein
LAALVREKKKELYSVSTFFFFGSPRQSYSCWRYGKGVAGRPLLLLFPKLPSRAQRSHTNQPGKKTKKKNTEERTPIVAVASSNRRKRRSTAREFMWRFSRSTVTETE